VTEDYCSLVEIYRRFRRTCLSRLQDRRLLLFTPLLYDDFPPAGFAERRQCFERERRVTELQVEARGHDVL
jgi:hypothetical protein